MPGAPAAPMQLAGMKDLLQQEKFMIAAAEILRMLPNTINPDHASAIVSTNFFKRLATLLGALARYEGDFQVGLAQ
jgi:hypothetical protein